MAKRIKRESPFRKILAQLMREKNLSIRAAAQIAAVAPSTIAGWRAGRTPDNFEAVQKLAIFFGVGLAFMLTGKQDSFEGRDRSLENTVWDEGEAVYYEMARIQIQPLVLKKK
jgi:transcriptional regulator with XRE-family HTH domain